MTNGAHGNVVGAMHSGNLISANAGRGVYVYGAGTDHNQIISNHIGTDYAGAGALANGSYGVHIAGGAEFNDIGGELVGQGNVIAGNSRSGVMIDGGDTMGNRLGGNLIGLGADGQTEIANGHHGVGIYSGAHLNQVGSSVLQPNTISASNWTGVAIVDANTNGVFGNRIGTNLYGTADRGNVYYGVAVVGGRDNVISSNRIAFNGQVGVRVDGAAALHNTITVNSITSNGAKGIENINGGNAELAPPVITSVTVGAVSGTACAGCAVEVFSDPADEGQQAHSPPPAIANAGGNWTWTGSASGPFVTATATDGLGNTSEFSAPYTWVTGWTFSGQATLADAPGEPAADVQIGLFGADAPGELGERLDGAATDGLGMFQVAITGTADLDHRFLHLAVIDEGWVVISAGSESGGESTTEGWLRFETPAPGSYGGNIFTVEPRDTVERRFIGRVFIGEVGDRSEPAPRVPVGLLLPAITCEEGLRVAEILTDDQGRFELAHVAPAGEEPPYFNVIVGDPDFRVIGALSESGGQSTDQGWLQFTLPPAGELGGNEFYGRFVEGVVLSPAAVADAHVSQASSTASFGDLPRLYTDFSSGIDSTLDRAFVYFDLNHIPSDATVTRATLEMYLEQAGGKEKVCMSVHRVLSAWCEKPSCGGGLSPITWDNKPAHVMTAAATHFVDKALGYKSWDVTSLVQSWVDGSERNRGLLLMGEEEGGPWSRYFSSREGAHPPHLVIHVTSPSGIETPTPTRTVTATPTPTATATPADRSIIVTGIEVNQAVQDQNTQFVRLVAGKQAVVRVHLKVIDGKGDLPGVHGTLRYPYPSGGIYYPMNAGGVVTARSSPDRGQLSHTLNFLLPASAAQGAGVNFVLAQVLPPAGVTFDGKYELVDTVPVSFETVPSMRLRLVGVNYITNTITYSPAITDYARVESWLRAAYPIPGLISTRTTTNWTSTTTLPTCGEVNTLLAQMKVLDITAGTATADTRYHGLVFDGGPLWYQMTGCCCNSGASSGPAGQGFGASGRFSWDRDGSYADWYAGHEIGHGYGQCHPGACGEPVGSGAHCGTYPYPSGRIGGPASAPSRFYGLDVETLTVMGPTWTDMMTYCDDLWISDFTYERILNRLTSPLTFGTERVAAGERLLVVGRIDLATDAVALEPFLRMPDTTYAVERVPGDYTIRLLGAGGAELAAYDFTPIVQEVEQNGAGASCAAGAATQAEPQPAAIFELVPWVAGAQKISITKDAVELASRTVSAHPPAVTITAPNGGETIAGDTISAGWTASDADGDSLTASVSYSADAGASWMTLAPRVVGTSLSVDAGLLAGSDRAMLRVMVSDGVNTASDETDDTFALTDRLPRVSIVSPLDGATFRPDQVVPLLGDAYDPEDGQLAEETLVWRSDRQGPLGTGRLLPANMLWMGTHVITLTTADSAEQEGSASVTIAIRRRAELPLIVK